MSTVKQKQQNRPVISVVIPLFNQEDLIANTIKSVISQSFSKWELIVVDDGSTDMGVDKVRAIQDSRIKILHQTNQGVSAARNLGVKASVTDLIALLDADDFWKPGYLENMWQLTQKYPDCGVYGAKYIITYPEGGGKEALLNGIPQGLWHGIIDDYFALAAISDPPLHSSSIVVKKEAITAIGGFPLGVVRGEDLLTWAKLACRYQIAYSTNILSTYNSPTSPKVVNPRFAVKHSHQDIVGQELYKLKESAPQHLLPSLSLYIALWHRMRASIYIDMGLHQEALKELITAYKFGGFSVRIFILAMITLMPPILAKKLRKASRYIADLKRTHHNS
ncbi:MAG: glycosyltransferase family 2 protein [Magnetococcales bacterium]|nr:glycosyltransferase family 2 protein [Magnetococcales bacterium]